MFTSTAGFTSLIFLSSVAFAQKLDKSPLHPNLDYLAQGLMDNTQPTPYTVDEWGAGWIAGDCKQIAEDNKFDPADVQTFNVHYSDVSLGDEQLSSIDTDTNHLEVRRRVDHLSSQRQPEPPF